MALLIVTCPCALGLATPLAMSVAIGRAARRDLLIKGGDALERLARPGLLLLDKTGTVTAGTVRLQAWRGDESARAPAAALERASAHPIARALADSEPAGGPGAVDVSEVIGRGIRGRVGGQQVAVGSPRFAAEVTGKPLPGLLAAAVAELAAEALTPVVVCINRRAVAVAGMGDPVRADAPAAVAALQAAGWRVELLSGDDAEVVRRVGARLGLEPAACTGGATPEGKLAVVRSELTRGPVVMVGDGVNDAAALAAATCGIAVHGSAEASLAAADVLLRRPGLAAIVELTGGARHTLAVVRRNFRFSLLYNLIGAGLAVTGFIHPLIGALMMPLSSLTVMTSSTRTRAFRGEP
jgi:Cu2+-exporting ATPase